MKHYQSIYPRLKRVLAGSTLESSKLRASTKLLGDGIGIKTIQLPKVARALNAAFPDVLLHASEPDFDEHTTVRTLARRVHNASLSLDYEQLVIMVYGVINRWAGRARDADLDPDMPLSLLGAAEDRLRRWLVQDIGGFGHQDIVKAWNKRKPVHVTDVVDLVESLRS